MVTFVAYIVGMSEFCRVVNMLTGSWAIQWSGMKTVGGDCDFQALPQLVVTFMIVIPSIIAIPAMFLIPNALQTEHLIDWEKEGWYSTKETDEQARSGLLANEYNNDGIGDCQWIRSSQLVNSDDGMDEGEDGQPHIIEDEK